MWRGTKACTVCMGLFKVEFDITVWISPFLLKSTNSKMGLNEWGFLWRETPVWGKWEGSPIRLGEPSDLKTSLIPSEGEERKFEWVSPGFPMQSKEGPPKWPCQFQVAVSFREQLLGLLANPVPLQWEINEARGLGGMSSRMPSPINKARMVFRAVVKVFVV